MVYIALDERTVQINMRQCITKTRLFKYIEKISPPKTENFLIKISDIFHISARNIDCGYSLEPLHRGDSNEYSQSMFLADTPVNPSFTI